MRRPTSIVLCNEQKLGEGYMQIEIFKREKHEQL